MPDLVAQGPEPSQTWRRTLPDAPITLGRTARSAWQANWDMQISGLHAILTWKEGKLSVVPRPDATNKILFRGTPMDEEFTAAVGEQFVIGQTTFTLRDSEPSPGTDLRTPADELTCSRQELQKIKFVDADERIEVLASLPGMIRYSPSDEELASRVAAVLLQGIPRAEVVAIVRMSPLAQDTVEFRSCSFRRPEDGKDFRPSRRLISEALFRRRQGVMHCWETNKVNDFTISTGYDWALCAPLPDEPAAGWGVYVTGRMFQEFGGPSRQAVQKSDLKFASLVADIYGSLRQVLDLQKRQTILARFLSRTVLAALAEKDMDQVLKARQTEVTVLFCDLRGSCRIAEETQDDLASVCDRMSEALGVMTRNIIDKDGVIGDFQGDAAMGFWGWPFTTDDQVEQAARAALAIRREFEQARLKKDNPLADFACGIGIANGPAIAGRLGTLDQFKVSVFGPVVNLAARLESMTKFFKVPILLDERAAGRLASTKHSHWARCRRLARVQPYGMRQTVMISELLPPAVEPGVMSDRDRRDYEAALGAFLAGRWQDAQDLLGRLRSDGPSAVLKDYIDRHGRRPPDNWNGVMELESK
jgi:adenylate cyclase